MFHILANTIATGGSVTDKDTPAAVDSEISQRNSHYILTEQYDLLAAALFGATITRANISVPTWNQVTKFNVWPPNRNVAIPSPPQLDTWFDYPPPLPMNEEIIAQITDTASEQATMFSWIAPHGNWTMNLPKGKGPLPIFEARVFFTASSITQNLWSGLQNITFEQSLRGGTYAVVGCEVQGTNLLAFRLVFPRAPIWHNRKLRPGGLCTTAIGDLMSYNLPKRQFSWGEWGRFSTFELPQMEFWINTTGTPAIECRLWLVWLSDSMDVQY